MSFSPPVGKFFFFHGRWIRLQRLRLALQRSVRVRRFYPTLGASGGGFSCRSFEEITVYVLL